MATTTRRERPVRALVTLAVIVIALLAGLLVGTKTAGASLAPGLALDLEGGTQLVLQPVVEKGVQVTDQNIKQAIDIIRQRVDASGVSEAEITSQGRDKIVVALPGQPSEATLDLVRESAQMLFRPVLLQGASQPTTAPSATPPAADAPKPADASDPAWLTPDVLATYAAYDCTNKKNLTGGASLLGDKDKPVVTCEQDGSSKYVLGPVEVRGTEIASASSGIQVGPTGALTGVWVTNIKFTGKGSATFRDITSRLQPLPRPRNQFAIVLDGLVISAPSVRQIIANGQAEISGSFTRESAATLARELNFGALPLTFEVQSEQQISATLGSEQLQRGLLAGLVGLVLVAVYSLVQYRALGFVTIFSLVVAGALTYLLVAVLSWTQGYRLSLPGVAGIIVAIGITADSFIVYFERIRDELRDGRTLPAAVEEGWRRARRTILASDAVNFLAAVVLYFLAVGGVRGFAFTLGLTTLIDLGVVFLFTHPTLMVLARTKFFADGHRFSGLDPVQLGARSRYVGRGRVATAGERAGREPSAVVVTGATAAPVAGAAVPFTEGDRRLTIAERRVLARQAENDAAAEPGTATVPAAALPRESVDGGTDRKDA